MLRLTLAVGLPLLLLPALFPRKVSAKKLNGALKSSASRRSAGVPREQKLQDLVDDFRARLAITNPVRVVIVPANKLVVSVEKSADRPDGFSLSLEEGFLDRLTSEEVRAVVAHELGHVWIFTHHPFLQTEEQANQIAMQIVDRSVLESVYEKVWKRTGTKGTLQYLPVE